jgi:hypothetical protein
MSVQTNIKQGSFFLPFEICHFQLAVGDEFFDIPYLVTNHAHVLIGVGVYAAALVGCTLKEAARKISVVADKISVLEHNKRKILQHDKVSYISKQLQLVD